MICLSPCIVIYWNTQAIRLYTTNKTLDSTQQSVHFKNLRIHRTHIFSFFLWKKLLEVHQKPLLRTISATLTFQVFGDTGAVSCPIPRGSTLPWNWPTNSVPHTGSQRPAWHPCESTCSRGQGSGFTGRESKARHTKFKRERWATSQAFLGLQGSPIQGACSFQTKS